MICLPRLKAIPLAVLLALSSMALPGCSSGSGGGAPVEGMVTLDNAPVDGGVISFVPAERSDHQVMVFAKIHNGKYVLTGKQGPVPGRYRVDIGWKKKTGRQVPSSDPPNKIDEEIQLIPKKYNEKSATFVDIKSAGNKFDYAISSKEGANDKRTSRASR